MVASAVGDALGAPYEFAGPNPSAPCDLEGGGQFRWEPGEWTDDTQMALALLTVLADGSTDLDRIDTAMLDWFAAGRATSATRPAPCSAPPPDPATPSGPPRPAIRNATRTPPATGR